MNEAMRAQAKMLEESRKETKRQIRLADKTGGTVPYSLAELIESGVSVAVIRRVYRG